jgi:predicted nuclease of restriction endonuclease-like (RecB) superfamily
MLFERSALSKKPTRVIQRELSALRKGDTMSPNLVFQNPYLLDFSDK